METPQGDMSLVSDLFTEKVMQDAIADKTAMVQAQMEAQQNGIAKYTIDADDAQPGGEEQKDDSDDDYNIDDDEDKMLRSMAEQRLAMMKEIQQEKQVNKTLGHGTYIEITEQEFLPLVTKTKYVVIAFFHKDFQRCKIVDMHLQKICQTHEETRFVRIDAEKCPFFTSKLQIQMLPTIVLFDDGIAFDRIVGFEELGGEDDFPTMALTRRLVNSGVILGKNKSERGEMKVTRKRGKADSGSDEEY